MELRANPRPHHDGLSGLHWFTQIKVMTGLSVAFLAGLALFAPPGLGMPIFSTVALVAGGVLASYAWARGLKRHDRVSIWDVAGTLIFVGFFAAILSRQDQILQLVAQ